MKKLNNKGFTLVELLAVIIILAIVVGISIPSVTTIINRSKTQALGVATKTAVDYLQDQFSFYTTDVSLADPDFTKITLNACNIYTNADATGKAVIAAMGFDTAQIHEVAVEIDTTTGKAYVEVLGIEKTGDYYITAWNKQKESGSKVYYGTSDATIVAAKKAGTAKNCMSSREPYKTAAEAYVSPA